MGVAKVLVVGAVQGHLKKALQKITKLHQKQDFALCLVVGDLFGEHDDAQAELIELLSGEMKITLPIYFTLGDSSLPPDVIAKLESADEVCHNLIYLGRKGTFTTSDGIRIVSLGGRQVRSEASVTKEIGKFDPLFLDSEARALHGAHSAHILLTNQWPANTTRLSDIEVPETIKTSTEGSQPVAMLNMALKPWYHFSCSPGASWEREPFKHPEEYGSLDNASITRFKSCASVLAPNKEWMTAFSIDTTRPPAAPSTTQLPFLRVSPPRKRAAPADFDFSSSHHHNRQNNHPRHPKRKRHYDPNLCFMCLSNADFKAHLVASIGDESMVTCLRGPLPLPTTFPELSFSGHAMIIPQYHAADETSHSRRPQDDIEKEFIEMTRYRKALSTMVGVKSDGRLGTITTEVNRTGIRHFHWQVLAMPSTLLSKNLVLAAFKILAKKHKYPPFEICPPENLLHQRNDFVRIWLWTPSSPTELAEQASNGVETDQGKTESYFFPLSPNLESFYLWYPREVCAGLLQLEERTNWMATLLPDDAEEQKLEEADVEGLKADFGHYDFAMQ